LKKDLNNARNTIDKKEEEINHLNNNVNELEREKLVCLIKNSFLNEK